MKIAQERNIARIEVQKSFCNTCIPKIKQELQKIKDITNVGFCQDSTMVFFNFIKANELAYALNTLTALGYPEVGEAIPVRHYDTFIDCSC